MLCPYCERGCRLDAANFGVCRMYEAAGGEVRERFPDLWCAYFISRMESIPFYHAYPGARCLVVGTAGCNLDCRYCANAAVAKEDPAALADILLHLSPEVLVGLAVKHGCHAIVFSVNEPTVSLPTLRRVSVVAKAAGIPMGCLTNGYATPLGTDLLADIFSFVNVSLKGLAVPFCQKFLGISDSAPVIRNIRELARRCHVEVTTPVIEAENDHELQEMADILADIDPQIPWHVFRLLPAQGMGRDEYPGLEAVNAKLVAHRKRLPYLYFHNFIGSRWVDTACPRCGQTVITRHSLGCCGDRLGIFALNGDRCPECGYHVRLFGRRVAWNSKEAAA